MKRKFFEWVVRHRLGIIAVYVAAAFAAAIASQLVGVNYSMTDYLPESSASTIALDVMEKEFDGDIPNARVMVKDVSVAEALDTKARLEAVDGVSSVVWLDDFVSLSVPLEMADADAVAPYFKDGNALFSLTVDYDRRLDAVTQIRDIIGDEGCMSGSVVSDAVATQSTVSEIRIITAIAVLAILLVLVITTKSWVEPLLVLAGLGVSVLLNSGTNLMFGTISFVTDAAGSILQVAIALDFSVFLLHRYAETRGTTGSAKTDMVEALCGVSTAIISSACTITMGFLALCVMEFGIGPDLGFALAKGMVISLVTAMTFVPASFVCADRLIERSMHRPFVPKMEGFAASVMKVCVPLAAVFVLIPVPAFLASTSDEVQYRYGSSHIFGSETQIGGDIRQIEDVFGKQDTYVLMVPTGDIARERQLSDALHDIPEVASIISYVDMASTSVPVGMLDEDALALLQSDNYSRMVLTVDADFEGEATFDLVDEVRATAQRIYPDQWMLAGEGVSTADLMSAIVEDKEKVDVFAVVAVLVVLLVALRSLSLPVILVFVIETGIWLNFAVPYFTGAPEFYLSYLIVSTIQLGVTVDYAILLTDRYKELRTALPKSRALRRAIATSIIPILTSGTVLAAVGLAMGAVSSHGVLSQLGTFLGVGVIMSLFFVLAVLPGVLYVLDGLIGKTTWKANFVHNA
ncbi:MAG: MMPL family transporter [Slackia sp.]|nr:MMPL family transporter [Slackia sp.]